MGPGSGWGPTERGFHKFFGLTESGHNHYTKVISYSDPAEMNNWTQGGPHLTETTGVDPEPEAHSTILWTRVATEYIDEHLQDYPDQPFFMLLSYTAPHDPLQSEESWMDTDSCKDIKNWRRKTYCGMVFGIDQGIGVVASKLEDMGLMENTIIMFSS